MDAFIISTCITAIFSGWVWSLKHQLSHTERAMTVRQLSPVFSVPGEGGPAGPAPSAHHAQTAVSAGRQQPESPTMNEPDRPQPNDKKQPSPVRVGGVPVWFIR